MEHLLSPRIMQEFLKISLSKTMKHQTIFYCLFLLILFQLQLALMPNKYFRGKISNYTSGPSKSNHFESVFQLSANMGRSMKKGLPPIILEDNFP